MRRVDSHNAANDGVIEDTFEKIAKLSGGGLEAIVTFPKYDPLHVLSGHVPQRQSPKRRIDLLFKIATKLFSILPISLDYLLKV